MNLGALSICVALCLGLTVGHVQLTVYRGTLVHSRVIEQIEILQDHLLGIDENNLGEVSGAAIHLLLRSQTLAGRESLVNCPCISAFTTTAFICSFNSDVSSKRNLTPTRLPPM